MVIRAWTAPQATGVLIERERAIGLSDHSTPNHDHGMRDADGQARESARLRLGVVVPTLNAAGHLPACLRALGAARRPRLDLVVVDGGSSDGTAVLARRLGARVLSAPRGRGTQLAAGARMVEGDWLLFVHADTVLGAGWLDAALGFAAVPDHAERAAYFRFALDDRRAAARALEAVVVWRCRILGLPYGDQALLLARSFYERLGGFRPLPLMEDVDLVRRIGHRRLVELPIEARTSAERYRRDGYWLRSARNLLCLSGYLLGLPPRVVRRLYG
jgi:rSAM/selenodomain-associated transferase 2